MHELSVCQALMTQVAEIAAEHGAGSVTRITIEVGPLSGIEPQLLRQAFEIIRLGSRSECAELKVETTGVTVRCLTCNARTDTRANRLVCAACGGYRTQVIAGDELRLRRIEMHVADRPSVFAAQPRREGA